MNAHGSAIEGRLGRPIMSSLHAGWSFGGFAGAAAAWRGATAAGVDPRLQNTIAAALLLLALLGCADRARAGQRDRGAASASGCPRAAVVLMAVLCFLTMVTEGAMADWGGVYLRGDLGASAGVAAAAFAAFAAGMTVGAADRRLDQPAGSARRGCCAAARRSPRSRSARCSCSPSPVVALVGLALVGIGVANGVPLLFSAAGAGGVETPPGPSIAAVSSMGSLGLPRRAAVHRLPRRGHEPAAGAHVAVRGDRGGRRAARRAGDRPRAARPRAGARGPVRFAAILSDLDGVLVDSGDAVEAVWRDWAAEQASTPTRSCARATACPRAR